MVGIEDFSVYRVRPVDSMTIMPKNPLEFLKGDEEQGWHVARNLRKPLNHLDFLKRKEEIAVKLNLHNVVTPSEVFNQNYCLLEQHRQGKISLPKFLDHLSSQLKGLGHQISIDEIRILLQDLELPSGIIL